MARQNLRVSLFFLVLLIRDQGLAYFFGAGNFADTFNLAAWTTETSAVALSSSTALRKHPVRVPILFALAFLGILLAQLVGTLGAPALSMVPIKLELAVQLTQILFLVLPILVLGGLTSFLFQAVSMVVGLVLAGVVLPAAPDSGFKPIVGMALGWILGGILYSTRFMKDGFARAPENPALAPAAIPIALGISVILASTKLIAHATGAISRLAYPAHLALAVGGLFWISCIGGAGGAGGREESAEDRTEECRRNFHKLLQVLLPLSVGLILFRVPLTRAFFQYGRFYPEDALSASRVLAIDSITLMGAVFLRIISPLSSPIAAPPGARRGVPPGRKTWLFSPAGVIATSTLISAALAAKLGFWALAIGPAAAAVLQSIFLARAIPGAIQRFLRPFGLQLVISVLTGLICLATFHGIEQMFGHGVGGLSPGFRVLGLGLIFLEGFAILAFTQSRPRLRLSE